MAGEPSFFSIGVGDADKARAFYGALFGWGFAEPPSGNGAVIETSTIPGGIHGGDPGASPYLFFRVDEIEAAAARVRELGGQIEEIGCHRARLEVVTRLPQSPDGGSAASASKEQRGERRRIYSARCAVSSRALL